MDYSILNETKTGNKIDKRSVNPCTIENENNDKGLITLKEGQQITGTVVSMGEQVTLDFNGQKVIASKNVMGNAVPGEVKTFEVVKATSNEIELKLLDQNNGSSRLSFKAKATIVSDFDIVLTQKEQTVKKIELEAEAKDIKTKLEDISTKLTGQDCMRLEKEGFPIESFTINGLDEAIGRMKAEVSAEAIKISSENKNTTSNIDSSSTENKTSATEKQKVDTQANKTKEKEDTTTVNQSKTEEDSKEDNIIAGLLKKANLPVTPENLTKVKKALDYSEAVIKLDNKAMQNLITKDAEPTPENIYKACYSSTAQSSIKLTDKAWSELEGQVKAVIKEAGYEPNAKNMEEAKWIIESKLPLTVETFEYKKELEQIKTMDKNTLLNEMVEGIKDGVNPKNISLRQPKDVSFQKVISDIKALQPETIEEAVRTGIDLSIKNLVKLQENQDKVTFSENTTLDKSSSNTKKNSEASSTERVEALTTEKDPLRPDMSAGEIKKANQNTAGQNTVNQNTVSQDIVNQKIVNQNTVNQDIVNQDIVNQNTVNQNIVNQNIVNQNTVNYETVKQNTLNQNTTHQNIAKINRANQNTSSQDDVNQKATSQNTVVQGIQEQGNTQQVPLESDMINLNAIRPDITNKDIGQPTVDKVDTRDNTKADTPKSEATEPTSQTVDIKEAERNTERQNDDAQGDSNNSNKENSNSGSNRTSYTEIKAKRQLEEIRLKMTLEAATQLEKQGIRIETEQLSKVVDALKELENKHYKEYFKEAEVETTDASLQALKDTTESIEQLKYIPNYVLGSTLADRNTQTIPGLLAEGNKLQANLVKAGAAYETLMTTPNSEYGDSIKKAFANADSLLSEMKMENTEANQRAVRILGYNQMEITQESINQVKAYDLQVATLMKNLHPAVTVRMIKDGINPMDMPITELNQTIDKIKEEQGITSEDKYSTYLRQLDKTDGISEGERKAYIGVYRLLYNVEKSDGAALGAVIKADREITLDHLLTAVQTGKKGRLDAVIDDEFGTLQGLARKEDSLAEQLSSFTSEKGQSSISQPLQADVVAEQTEYLDRILKQLKDELTPERLTQVGINSTQLQNAQTSTIESTSGSIHKGIWEMIKNIPVEKLHDQLQNMAPNQETEDVVYAAKAQEIRELSKTSEQSIRFLNDYHVPSTPLNIVMANNMLSNGESPIKKLIKLQKENKVENSEISLKEIDNLTDTLIDKHSMQEVYTKLEMDAKAAINQSYSEEKIDSQKLAELKSLGQQMSFAKKMAEKEYYQIPVETDKGVTNINLTILRGTQTAGKVSVTIWSEQLGNVKADFSLKDKTLKGLISSDNRNGLEQLQSNTGEIEKAANENDVTIKQLDFVVQRREKNTYSYQNPKESSSVNADSERTLYRIAKAIVQTVRAAENSVSNTEQAVS